MGLRVPPGQRKARTTSARGGKTTPLSHLCSPKNFKLCHQFFWNDVFFILLVGTAVVARATESIESKSCDGWLSRNQLKGKFKWDLTSPLILPVCVVSLCYNSPWWILGRIDWESRLILAHVSSVYIHKSGSELIYSCIHSFTFNWFETCKKWPTSPPTDAQSWAAGLLFQLTLSLCVGWTVLLWRSCIF